MLSETETEVKAVVFSQARCAPLLSSYLKLPEKLCLSIALHWLVGWLVNLPITEIIECDIFSEGYD